MFKRTEESTGLLSSRLSNRVGAPSKGPDVDAMRHKSSETYSVPTYDVENDAEDDIEDTAPAQKAKRFKLPKVNRKQADMVEEEPENAAEFDDLIDEESYRTLKRQERSDGIKKRVSKVVTIVIVLLCLYLAFLIYGLTQTNYIYDDNGQVVPEVLSVNDLETLDQYTTLSSYYLRVRILYENVLGIDYRLSQNSEDTTLIAMDYTALLDDVSKLSTDLSAAQLDTAYTPILSQLHTLVSTHIAVYLQNISGALTTNNEEKASQAIQGREVIESEFTTLTANMAQLCNATTGAKNGDIYSWSPQGYMDSLVQGGE